MLIFFVFSTKQNQLIVKIYSFYSTTDYDTFSLIVCICCRHNLPDRIGKGEEVSFVSLSVFTMCQTLILDMLLTNVYTDTLNNKILLQTTSSSLITWWYVNTGLWIKQGIYNTPNILISNDFDQRPKSHLWWQFCAAKIKKLLKQIVLLLIEVECQKQVYLDWFLVYFCFRFSSSASTFSNT